MRTRAVLLTLLAAAPVAAQTLPDPARVYELAQVEVLPRPRNAADFTAALRDGYPAHLRAWRVEGTVQVTFVVGPDGVPHSAHMAESTETGFDSVTIAAVGVLRFTPAMLAGQAVSVRVVQPVQWRLPAPEPVARTSSEDFHGMGPERAAGKAAAKEPIDGVYEMADVDELPRLLNGPAFQRALSQHYPFGAAYRPREVTVRVRFRVDEDGWVRVPHVTHSSDARFNDPTLRVIPVLRFRPAKVNGRPVKVWVEQPIVWTPPPRPATPRARRP